MRTPQGEYAARRRLALGLGAAILVTASIVAAGPSARRQEPPTRRDSLADRAHRHLMMAQPEEGRPRSTPIPDGPYIVVDTHTNRLYLRTVDSVLLALLCSTGTGAELSDSTTGRSWRFDTPRGLFAITAMAPAPVWRKPDWAFIEEGEPVPTDAAVRLDSLSLGDYSLAFGDGYYIHGTIYERLIGVAVTHGCIRLAADDLSDLYALVDVGTSVVVF